MPREMGFSIILKPHPSTSTAEVRHGSTEVLQKENDLAKENKNY
jgi:hypothetical protein